MWKEINECSKRYYEKDKKYSIKVYRNSSNGLELSVTETGGSKNGMHIFSLYPLNYDIRNMKKFGPINVKLVVTSKEMSEKLLKFIKTNLGGTKPNLEKLYSSTYSDYIVEYF